MIRQHKHFIIAIFIILLATLLRIYQLEERATFYYDESYDALQVRHMIIQKKLTLLGHPYSISGTYQGPLYYYLVTPWLIFGNYNPVSIAAAMVLVNLCALVLLGILSYRLFGFTTSLFAMGFYAVSPAILELARKSWYPAPIEILAPACFWLFLHYHKHQSRWSIFLAALCVGMAMQFHILAFPLVLFGLLILLVQFSKRDLILFITGLFLGFSPIIFFELRHNFFNSRMAFHYIMSNSSTVRFSYINQLINEVRILLSGLYGTNRFVIVIGAISTLIGWWVSLKFNQSVFKFLTLYTVVSLLTIALLRDRLHFHYVAILHFIPVFFTALFLSELCKRKKSLRIIVIFGCLAIGLILVQNGPLVNPLKWGIEQNRKVAQIIAHDIPPHAQFNVVLLDHAESRAWPVRYFLDVFGVLPMGVEDYAQSPIIYTLAKDIQTVNSIDLWELRSGGPFVVEKQWPADLGYTLFKLHYLHPSQPSEDRKI